MKTTQNIIMIFVAIVVTINQGFTMNTETPLMIKSDTAKEENSIIQDEMITESVEQSASSYYILEKSLNKTHWQELTIIDNLESDHKNVTHAGVGEDPNEVLEYGIYYRVKKVNSDNSTEHLDMFKYLKKRNVYELTAVPSLDVDGNLNLIVDSEAPQKVRLELLSVDGELLFFTDTELEAGQDIISFPVDYLESGVHILMVNDQYFIVSGNGVRK